MNFREVIAKAIAPSLQTETQIKSLVEAEVNRAKAALPILANYDPKNEGYRRIGGGMATCDLDPIRRDRMFEYAYYMWYNSLMFKRLALLDQSFLFGENMGVSCRDTKVQDIVNEFWGERGKSTDGILENDADLNFPDLFMWQSILGEQCWPVTVIDGRVELGYLDPYNIYDVTVSKNNTRRMGTVIGKDVLQYEKRTFDIIRKDRDPAHRKTYGRLTGECFFFSVNHPPNVPRGISDYQVLFDWIDNLERYGFNFLERAEFMLNFVWDVTLEGYSEDQIREFVKNNPPPEPGSIRAHNEHATWSAVNPDLKAYDFKSGFDTGKGFVLGGAGRPESWFGTGGKSYQTEADLMMMVPIKDLDKRQKYIKVCIATVIQYVIDQAIIVGRLSPSVDTTFTVNMPEISKKDLVKIASVLPQITNALTIAKGNSWITDKTASKVVCSVLQQFGEEISIDQEFEEAQKEKDEIDYQDYIKLQKMKKYDKTTNIHSQSPRADKTVPDNGKRSSKQNNNPA